MPRFRITGPDGHTYEVTAPDGATEQDVLAYVQANASPQKSLEDRYKAAGIDPSASDPTDGMSTFQKAAAGVGKSIVDTGRGIGQLFGAVDTKDVEGARRRDAALLDTGAGLVGNIAGQAAQMAIPASMPAKVASYAGKAAPYLGAATRAGLFGATQGVGEGESRIGNAGESAAWGVAGQGIAAGANRLARGASDKIPEMTRQGIDTLRRAGVPLHASQVVDSKAVKTLASAASSLPFSGAGKAAGRQQEAFNRAVGRTFGADAPVLGDDVMQAAKQALGAEYDDIFKGAVVAADDKLMSRIAGVEAKLATKLKPDEAAVVKANIEQIRQAAAEGVMPAELYQALRSDLAGPGRIGLMLKKVRGALDDAAYRSLGAAKARRLKAVNSNWANMRTTEDVLKQVEGAKGNVKPAALWPAVRKGSTKEMRELARAGQTVLKNPIPDSGTAPRLMAYSALGGLGGAGAMSNDPNLQFMAALLAGGAVGGRTLNSPLLARYLSQGAGREIQGMARLMKPAPLLLPAVANAGEED